MTKEVVTVFIFINVLLGILFFLGIKDSDKVAIFLAIIGVLAEITMTFIAVISWIFNFL